jgi:hypothetical protein
MRKPIVIAAGLIVLLAFPVLQDRRRSAAQKKYPAGTSMQQAMSELRLPYYVHTNSDDALGWRYLVLAQKDGLVMQFGRDQRLISVVLYTDYK